MNKKNNPIILDFDYTLFDTAKFREEIIKNLVSLGVTKEIYHQAYAEIRHNHDEEYLPNVHLKIISQITGKDLERLQKKYFEALNSCQKYLYPDTIPFLEKLPKQKVPLYLLTFGNPIFQKQKVEASGIAYYFRKTIYTNKDKFSVTSLIPNADKAIFINDNPHEIEALQKLFPQAHFVQIARKNGKKFGLKITDIITTNKLII